MPDTRVVEVRFDAEVHELAEDQVFGLLRAFDSDFDISVGLGYGGKAAAVLLDVPVNDADRIAQRVAEVAASFDLTVTDREVLELDEYEQRALAEMDES